MRRNETLNDGRGYLDDQDTHKHILDCFHSFEAQFNSKIEPKRSFAPSHNEDGMLAPLQGQPHHERPDEWTLGSMLRKTPINKV
jgi:hypothetical protein